MYIDAKVYANRDTRMRETHTRMKNVHLVQRIYRFSCVRGCKRSASTSVRELADERLTTLIFTRHRIPTSNEPRRISRASWRRYGATATSRVPV